MDHEMFGDNLDFKYEPLDLTTDTIRLAQLQGIDEDGRPVIRLYHTKISQCRYYAISYTWETSVISSSPETVTAAQYCWIVVNGRELSVGRNLHDFLVQMILSHLERVGPERDTVGQLLPHFSKLGQDRATFQRLKVSRSCSEELAQNEKSGSHTIHGLWIDAVCLDQSNPIERNHQVSQMHEIYLKADLVLVWLGIRPELSELSKFEKIGWGPPDFSQSYAVTERALSSLLGLAYWSRAWVLQELNAAKEIRLMCNNLVVQWDDFWASLDVMPFCSQPSSVHAAQRFRWIASDEDHSLADEPGAWVKQYMAYRHFSLHRSGPMTLSLVTILRSFGELQCSDPRDRIYSIRSLLHKGEALAVDYNESAANLAIRAAKHFNIEPQQLETILTALKVYNYEWAELTHRSGDGALFPAILTQHTTAATSESNAPRPELSEDPNAILKACPDCKTQEGAIWTVLPEKTYVLCSQGSMHIFTLRLGSDYLRIGPVYQENDEKISEWVQGRLTSNRDSSIVMSSSTRSQDQ